MITELRIYTEQKGWDIIQFNQLSVIENQLREMGVNFNNVQRALQMPEVINSPHSHLTIYVSKNK